MSMVRLPCNQAAEEITGWAHEHAIGRDFDEVFNIFDETTNCKMC